MSSYLGVPPQSGFITTAKQRITSSTNNYVDLDHSISSLADVIVWVNFVKQDSTNLTLTTSTRITLGGTLVASDVVEIAYLGKAVATQNPSTNSVTNDMLAGSIANSKLANSSITLNGSAVSLGGSATVGGDNTPYFEANMSATQTLSDATWTKLNYNTEVFDSASAYDTSNYRFTPQTAGKYFCYLQVVFDAQAIDVYHRSRASIVKNGSFYKRQIHDNYDNYFGYATTGYISAVIDFNGSSDYIEPYGYFDLTSGTGRINNGNESIFGAYKLIT